MLTKLLEGHKANFETLGAAFANGDVALVDCLDKTTGQPVAVICAINKGRWPGEEIEIVPFARLFDGDPYEQLAPPCEGGGYRLDATQASGFEFELVEGKGVTHDGVLCSVNLKGSVER